MRRQFRHIYTTRYDESDYTGSLTPAAFVRYLQDIAMLDAEDARLEGDNYWVARRTVLSFAAPVQMHTLLELTTYGIGFTRITAQRGYEARIAGEESSEPVISARTLWVYVDGRGRPARLPERINQIWLPDGPSPQHAEAPWPPFPQSVPDVVPYTVRYSDTDRMKHMNNAAYVEVLDDAAWEAYREANIAADEALLEVLDYDIDYGESARLGEELTIETWFDPQPSAGKEFTRLQHMKRGETTLVRARSRWVWRA